MPSAIVVTAAIIAREGKFLIAQRANGDWEFPGGKVEAGETLEECLAREILEELELQIAVSRPFLVVEHAYPDKRIHLHSFLCTLLGGEAVANDHVRFAWVAPVEFPGFSFAAADVPIVRKLLDTNIQDLAAEHS